MASTNNRFKRNAEATGVEPKVVKSGKEENETVNSVEEKVNNIEENVATTKPKETPAVPAVQTTAVTEQNDENNEEDYNMTVMLNGMVDIKQRFKKREAKSKLIQQSITPTMFDQLQFLVDTNMIRSRNDFICQLVENALNNIFSNPEVRDAYNSTREWEK